MTDDSRTAHRSATASSVSPPAVPLTLAPPTYADLAARLDSKEGKRAYPTGTRRRDRRPELVAWLLRHPSVEVDAAGSVVVRFAQADAAEALGIAPKQVARLCARLDVERDGRYTPGTVIRHATRGKVYALSRMTLFRDRILDRLAPVFAALVEAWRRGIEARRKATEHLRGKVRPPRPKPRPGRRRRGQPPRPRRRASGQPPAFRDLALVRSPRSGKVDMTSARPVLTGQTRAPDGAAPAGGPTQTYLAARAALRHGRRARLVDDARSGQ